MKTKWFTNFFVASDFKKEAEQVDQDIKDFLESKNMERWFVFYITQNPDGVTEDSKDITTLLRDENCDSEEILSAFFGHLRQLRKRQDQK